MVDKTKIDEFVRACHKAAELGLINCSSGNMSYRLDENAAILSGSGSWLSEISAGQVSICNIDNAQKINGAKPTIESGFHLGILRNRKDVNVVLHFQSPFATVIACGEKQDRNFNVIIEVPVYIGEPVFVDLFMPGSKELANAVIEAMENHNMAILKNHGLVTIGSNFNEAIQRAIFFELACKIIVLQQSSVIIPDDAVKTLSKIGRG